jgi:hypothetical protein
LLGQHDQIMQAASQPVEPPDDDRIASSGHFGVIVESVPNPTLRIVPEPSRRLRSGSIDSGKLDLCLFRDLLDGFGTDVPDLSGHHACVRIGLKLLDDLRSPLRG